MKDAPLGQGGADVRRDAEAMPLALGRHTRVKPAGNGAARD